MPEQKSERKRKRILVINDTQEILELFKLILEEEAGHEVILDSYRPQMLEIIKECNPDLIISDHVFGEEKIGWQLIQRLKMDRQTATIPMIVCSGAVHELKEMEGLKPVSPAQMKHNSEIDDFLSGGKKGKTQGSDRK